MAVKVADPKIRRRLWILLAAVLIAMLIPMRQVSGGTVQYKAVLYGVTQEHSTGVADHRRGHYSGTRVRVLAFEVYNSVVFVPDDIEHTLTPASP